jgi:hypothetical protein
MWSLLMQVENGPMVGLGFRQLIQRACKKHTEDNVESILAVHAKD